MIRGGIAGKFGDHYEGLWAAARLMDVFLDRAREMRIEPVTEDSRGFEFWVTSADGTREWHQCKRRGAGGRWTATALAREGVLDDFGRKLSGRSDICVFVSSDPTPELRTLVEKAQLFDGAQDFAAKLSQDERTACEIIDRCWKTNLESRHQFLRRCRVETVSDSSLRNDLGRLASLVFESLSLDAVLELTGYVFEHMTQVLTPDRVRADLSARGLKSRYGVVDPTISTAIEKATTEYKASFPRRGVVGQTIRTSAFDEARAAVLKTAGIKHVVVSGTAGVGKSVLLLDLIEGLRDAKVPVLAFRIDRFLAVSSLRELGQLILNRDTSPVGILGGRYQASPCVLLIDQIDAVSEASGRTGRARDLLFEMLREAEFFPQMRIVLASRAYDIANDHEYRQLSEAERSVLVRARIFEWDEQVAPVLAKLGEHPPRFSNREREILRLPLNLALFADLVSGGQTGMVALSRGRLIDELILLRQRELQRLGPQAWSVSTVLSRVADYMSDNQVLAAPEGVIAEFPGAADQLASLGLIVRVRQQIQLAHESFFDHLFASAFLSKPKRVIELLRASEQRLFRRTQVRQVFSQLRELGSSKRFMSNLIEVMAANDVRYLIKEAIGNWLASINDPTAAEIDLAISWLGEGKPLDAVARSVLMASGWFGALSERKMFDQWIASANDKRREFAKFALSVRAAEHGRAVAETLRRWWSGRPERCVELIEWFGWLHPSAKSHELEQLCLDAIAACPATVFADDKLPQRIDVSVWTHSDYEFMARVLGAWFKRWFEVIPKGQPFLRTSGNNEAAYWIVEAAQKAPGAFLINLLDSFVLAIRRDQDALAAGEIHQSEFANREADDAEHPHHVYIMLFRRALRRVAESNPKLARELVERIPLDLGGVALHLRFEAIAADGSNLAPLLVPALENSALFRSGYHGAEWLSFANAAHTALPFLSLEDQTAIEEVAMSHRPELAYVSRAIARDKRENEKSSVAMLSAQSRRYLAFYLSSTGQEEWAILKTIGSDRLSARGRSRLQELERKFTGQSLPEPHAARGGFVRSPIEDDATQMMSDDQWLRAMERYADNREREWLKNGVRGGSEQLAQALKNRVKSDPARFAALLERMPLRVNADYPEAVLWGLRESEAPIEVVVAAIKRGLCWQSREMSRSVCYLVLQFPEVARDEVVFKEVQRLAEFGLANDDPVWETRAVDTDALTVSSMLDRMGGIRISGTNGERGLAYEALEAVLWQLPETLDPISTLVDRRIEEEPLTSVRACMLSAVNAIAKYDSDRAIAFLRRLAVRDLRSVATRQGCHLLSWAAYNFPEKVREVTDALLASDDETLRANGLLILSGEALDDAERASALSALWPDDLLARRISAFRGAGNLSHDRVGDLAQAWVLRFLDDLSKEVRREASKCDWEDILTPGSPRLAVAEKLVTSSAFEEGCDRFIMVLEDRIDQFPALALQAITKITQMAGSSDAGSRGHHHAIHNLGKLLVNLYRAMETDEQAEKRILDLFDAYLALDLHGMREAISEYERI